MVARKLKAIWHLVGGKMLMVLTVDVGEPLNSIIKAVQRTPAEQAHFGTHESQKENE